MKKFMKVQFTSVLLALTVIIMIMSPIMVSAIANAGPKSPAIATNSAGSGILPVTFYEVGSLILLGILVFTFLSKKKRENM